MIFKREYKVGIKDIAIGNKATNKAILSYMENLACIHSDNVGYGILDVEKTKRVWLLLEWKLKVINRPQYGDELNLETWSKGIDKVSAYRDFKLVDKKEQTVAIASSKWVLVDTEKGSIAKADEKMNELYEVEDMEVFSKDELKKLKEPEDFENCIDCKIRKMDTDINGHLNNLNYLDIAYEAIPLEISKCQQFENVRITYKNEVKLEDNIKVLYSKVAEKHVVTIKSENQDKLHAIIELW